MSAFAQGWEELDGPRLLEALLSRTRTARGRRSLARSPWLNGEDAVVSAWDRVDEVRAWEETWGDLPVAAIEDVGADVGLAARGGRLDGSALVRIGHTLDALDHLAARLAERADDVPTLAQRQPTLVVAPGVRTLLVASFDETGSLSARRWPELGELRRRVGDLHAGIREMLERMVRGDEFADVLQDRFVTQRGDRYVLPVKANADRRAVGIVHAVSNRGQTVFVEPHAVVERNNALRIAEAELEETERRILEYLSSEVGHQAPSIARALDTAADLDADVARAALSRDLDGVRPATGRSGIVRLRGARHPLLALAGGAVVANDLTLDDDHPVLVVSGPNTGGKTIVLKTLGLCAALVGWGVQPPVAEGSRLDVFDRIHGIAGDRQDVEGAASTFSGHLAALSRMLEDEGPHVLSLVDEIASGTDPAQGAALAASLLETARDRGQRVLVTTHLSRLKTWALSDPRAQVAGMAFREGRPTYRMVTGVHGESHALDVARANGIPEALIARAQVLLADGDRDLAEALAALDAEHARTETARAALEAVQAEGAAAAARVAAREAELDARAKELETARAAGFLKRLEAAEASIAAVVADLQRSPDHAGVSRAKASIAALRTLAPKAPKATAGSAPARAWSEGDRVRLVRLGGRGTVEAVGKRIAVRTDRGLTVRVAARDLAPATGEERPAPAPPRPSPAKRPAVDLDQALRHGSNELDLRGRRVDEGLVDLERFLDRALQQDTGAVFVLHGHGTGAMKQAVRETLRTHPLVARWQPANADQGGDAWTVVSLAAVVQ